MTRPPSPSGPGIERSATQRGRRVRASLVMLAAVLAVLMGVGACSGGSEGSASPSAGAAPSAAPSVRSGLGWASGANGNYPVDVNAWASWTGRPVDVAIVFTTRSDWANITTASWPMGAFTRAKFPGQVSVAQPLYPKDGDEAACARGDYDRYWAAFGQTLTHNGRGDAYVRLGWEFNGNWFWWNAKDPAAFRSCFAHAATALRSTAPHVKIEWTMSAHRDTLTDRKSDVWAAYPGDQYVDVVSIDTYDSYPPSTSQQTWDQQCHQRSGLCTVAEYARAHHKQLAVPEWGLVRSTGGGGDNPYYIGKMHEFFAANTDILAYEAYFNNAEDLNVQSSLHSPNLNPNSARTYLDLFGKSG